MKAYLIDPYAEAVTEIETDGTFEHLYPIIECTTIEVVRLDAAGDGIFVDEERMFSFTRPDGAEKRFFTLGSSQPLVGKGVVMGGDSEGESQSPVCTLERVKGAVKFFSLAEVRALATSRHD